MRLSGTVGYKASSFKNGENPGRKYC